ncbi:MAG: FAD-dependent oxidoreductase, partial [Pseudorhodoplanes sp.]
LDARGRITAERVVGEKFFACDDVILAIGQENAFPWIENDLGIEFDQWHVPKVTEATFQSTRPNVFFGGDAAFGPKNIIWAVEHGHQAAISIHKHCAGEPDQTFECDDVLVAVGQENAFPWIERDIGIEFNKWDMPVVDETTFASTHPMIFFGGDAAFGPKNIIWAVAQGHDAALSIHRLLSGEDITERPLPHVDVISQKMGIHEWSYDNDITLDQRYRVPLREKQMALRDIKAEVELGYDVKLALGEAHRCLNCDVQTVFAASLCIECDACVDICPMDCITFTANGEEADLRQRLEAPSINLTQDLYVQDGLKTGRVMVKDEDVCLHCGLCAERCPTGAWDMQKYLIEMAHAGDRGCQAARSAA